MFGYIFLIKYIKAPPKRELSEEEQQALQIVGLIAHVSAGKNGVTHPLDWDRARISATRHRKFTGPTRQLVAA